MTGESLERFGRTLPAPRSIAQRTNDDDRENMNQKGQNGNFGPAPAAEDYPVGDHSAGNEYDA